MSPSPAPVSGPAGDRFLLAAGLNEYRDRPPDPRQMQCRLRQRFSNDLRAWAQEQQPPDEASNGQPIQTCPALNLAGRIGEDHYSWRSRYRAMDAIQTYQAHAEVDNELDQLLESERILVCCYSRLLATIWVRSELGRPGSDPQAPLQRLAGSFTTEAEALQQLEAELPTLLICTQLLEEGSGLALITAAKALQPELRTLLFLQHDNLPLLEMALATHSDGILLEKDLGSGQAMAAIRTVTRGGFYLDSTIATRMVGRRSGTGLQLSQRELDVMQQVVYGLNDKDVGIQLHLTVNTVKTHLKEVYQKLGVHNRTRAAIALLLMGLVAPPEPLLPEPADGSGPASPTQPLSP